MIRQAQPRDLPQLISLWQEAFLETKAEAQFYFARRHEDQNMLVMASDGLVTGMLSMLPVSLRMQGRDWPARYVFAVATRTSHRQQGISSRLLAAAHEAMAAEGSVASLLVPATPDLFDYYGKRGYAPHFFADEVRVEAQEIEAWPLTGRVADCDATMYLKLRDRAFSACSPFVRWDERALAFIKVGNEASGGAMLQLSYKGKTAAAVCEVRGDVIRVTEFAGDKADWRIALSLIHRRFQAKRYLVMLPANPQPEGSRRPFGMIHWLGDLAPREDTVPYLAFAKD